MELPEQDRQAFIDAARRRTQPQQGGAAFGVYPSSGKRPEKLNVSRDVNMPAQAARGWVAGTLGLPGDIESLGRMAVNFAFGPGGVNVDETPVLPTSDFYREYLPGYDPAPAARAASGLGALAGGAGSTKLAGAAVKGAKATGKALGPKAAEMAESYLKKSGLAPELIAYHGTPHRFAPEEGAPLGKFRSEKIGTGEGVQAYGHGLYLAESPGGAESYRKALSDNVFTIGGKDIKGPASKYGQPAQSIIRSELSMPEKMATYALDSAIKAGSNDPAADAIKHLTRHGKGNPDAESAVDMVRQWEQQGGKVEAGNLYTVDIPDEMVSKMLDWDKPLSQQPKTFQDLVSDLPRFQDSYVASKATAGEAYGELAGKLGSRAKASEALRQAGIPGIRYLDRQSRPTNIMDKRLQGIFEKHNGDIEKTANEYMRSIYDTPKEKEKIRASILKQLESPITRNFVIFPGEEESVKIIERKAEGGLVQDTDAIAAKLTGMDKDKALTHALRMANAKHRAQSTYKTLA